MKRTILAAAGCTLGALIGALVLTAPAQATDTSYAPTGSTGCPNATGWYVNQDENGDGNPAADTVDLRPAQKPFGLEFNGPSLIHHATTSNTGIKLADVTAGSFSADLKTGVLPLFKMETANPYSTINLTGAGKYWSSRIAPSDLGGQSNPVNSAGDLVGKWNYTTTTVVSTFGVGYAKDTGNAALVKSITFAGRTYSLTCAPPLQTTSPGPIKKPIPTKSTARPSSSPSSPVAVPTAVPPQPPSASLPVTGAPVALLVMGAVAVAAIGAGLLIVARRRKVEFTA